MAEPTIEIVSPDVVIAGGSLSIAVEVTTTKPFPISSIDIALIGTEGWVARQERNMMTNHSRHEERFVDEVVEVATAQTLPPGTHTFVGRFTVPAHSPPTHDSTPAYAFLRSVVTIKRPGLGLSIYRTRWFRIRKTTSQPPARVPATVTGSENRVTVSIASSRMSVGETIVGSIAATEFHSDVTFIAQLVALTNTYDNAEPRPWVWRTLAIDIAQGLEGAPVPFELGLPKTMPPTFNSTTHGRAWLLRVTPRTRVFASRFAVEIPLDIVDFVGPDVLAPATRVPPIGDHELSDAFVAFARRHGWDTVDADRDPDLGLLRLAVVRHRASVTHELAYAYLAPDGPSVIARLGYRSLGLGLEVTPISAILDLLRPDLEADHAWWDRHHHATARFDDQTVPVLRAVVPAIVASPGLGTLVRWTDREIVFARVTPSPLLDDLAVDLDRVAAALAAVAITPPPIDEPIDLDGWRTLATSLGGTLAVGDLSIDDGTIDGALIAVRVRWKGRRPTTIDVSIGEPPLVWESTPFDAATAVADATELVAKARYAFGARMPSDGLYR